MTTPQIGLIALEDPDALVATIGDRGVVTVVEPTALAVAKAVVDVWLVQVAELPAEVLQLVRDADVPALFLVAPDQARSWHRVLRKGVHDVAWRPVDPDELRARVSGLVGRRSAWNVVASALCREVAHDLRGPLQALHFTVAALQNEGAVSPGYEEDIDALLEAADVAGLMLNGLANQGRRPSSTVEHAVLDLTQLARNTASRKAFGGRVVVETGEAIQVRGPLDAVASAVEDVVRVAWIRAAGKRNVSVHCVRLGRDAVVVVSARAYDALLDNLPSLMWRERPILLRSERVPMPLAGLAYARDVVRALGGEVSVRREGQDMQVELRLPLA